MNAPFALQLDSSSCPSEDESASSCRKRRNDSYHPHPKGTKKARLAQKVSKWDRKNVQHHLHIFYAKKYIEDPADLIHKTSEQITNLTEEQNEYITNINKYLTFNMPLTSFHHQSKLVEDELVRCETVIKELFEQEKSWWVLKLKVFLAGLKTLFEDIRDYRKRNHPFQGFFTGFIGVFAELCCLRVQYCSKARHLVMENLKGVQVSSEPDLRLFKCGLEHEFSKILVSVIKVKPDSYYTPQPPSDKTYQRKLKKSRGSPRSSSSSSEDQASKSESPTVGSAESSDTEELTIEVDLNDKVLGQHAGELLLNLHNKHKKDDRKDTDEELKKKLTMPGMIVDETRVFFTLLEMTRKHYQKLKDNEELDQNDRAEIFYSNAKDILLEPERRSLIADFMLLNNIEF